MRGDSIPDGLIDVVMIASGYLPLEPNPGRDVPWRCIHTICGRDATPKFEDIERGRVGCNYCIAVHAISLTPEALAALMRSRWLQTHVDPKVAVDFMRSKGWEPLVPFPGSDEKWRCTHIACGHEMAPTYNNLRRGYGGGCKTCGPNSKLDPKRAAAFMVANGLRPLEPYPGSVKPWRCVHIACGKEVAPRYANIRKGQGGCKHCAYAAKELTSVVSAA